MDVANEILDAIEIIVDKKIRENTAQIYPGICKSVSGNSCVMSINGKDNTIQFYGSIPTVGAIYRVFVPDGNMSMAFIITGNDDRKDLHYSNPNLLDNWYFGNPVNQRGQTSYTGSGYMIDRWYADEVVLAISSGAIRVSRSSVGQWYARIMQNLETELSKEIAGKTCTLSALVKSASGIGKVQLSLFNISDNTSTTNIYADLTGGIDLITLTFVVPESYSGRSLGVFFYPDVDDSHRSNGCDVYAAKLELGSQQTLAHQDANGNWVLNEIPDYGEQLRRCQRYFVNFNPNKVNWFAMPPAIASNTTDAYSAVTLPVAMRAQPTVSYGGKIALSQTGDVQVTDIQVSGSTFAGNYLQLKYSVADGLTANSTYRVQGYNDLTSYIWLSADL